MTDITKFKAIFSGLDIAYGTYRIKKERGDGKQAGQATVVRNRPLMISGNSIWLVLILPLALFLFVPITLASGAALILTNIRWTIKAWWTKLRS